MTDEPRLKLWMVNQYAVGPNQAGGTRHAGLARGLTPYGVDSLIIASPRSYMSGVATGDAGIQDAQFLWIPSPSYSGNSLGRIINMVAFAVKASIKPLYLVMRRKLTRPHVVMGSSPSLFAALAAWMLAKGTGAAFVLEVRDIYPKTIVALGHASPSHPFVVLLGLIERFLYRRAKLIVSPLQNMDKHVMSAIHKTKDWVWIPNYVDLENTSKPSPVRADPRPFRVLYSGTHGVANSLHTVLEAAVILRNEDVEFWFYGDGVVKDELKQWAKSLCLNSVHFEDPVPKSRISEIQQSADALLMTIRDSSLWNDGFSPNKMYDYLASGRPVIFSGQVAHNPVEESGAGITVLPENPGALAEGILELKASSATERGAMGVNGRELVRTAFSLTVVARRLSIELKALRGSHG